MGKKNPHAAALGRKGGKARWKGVSSQERSNLARRAVEVRWEKARKKKQDS
jgi:hypothetical protein